MQPEISTQMKVAIAEAQLFIKDIKGLNEKLKAAMKSVKDHWLCTNEDEQFRSAVGVVMLHYGAGSNEFERMEIEMWGLNQLSAMLNAAQVGLSINVESLSEFPEGFEPIGLLNMWREIKGGI